MLLVTGVQGPEKVTAGDRVTFSVVQYNQDVPSKSQTDRVSWLVKTEDGLSLTNVSHCGPEWTLTIPESWSGKVIFVMPYMNSASTRISVRTEVAVMAQARVAAGAATVHIFREDMRCYASINSEPRFYVGTEVRYGSFRGLMNQANPYGPRYDPKSYEVEFDFWAYYLLPTIFSESKGAFTCINTYDRAKFTFGHMQFAAHTANANFVLLFRELLRLPGAATYFPDLIVHNGRIQQKKNGQFRQLENDSCTAPLQEYLNPDFPQVGPRSVTVAAKFMDWCARDPQFVRTMAAFAFRDQRRKLQGHARKLVLNGLSDKLCLVVLDILHQGRGKYVAIAAALKKSDPFDALLGIGIHAYRERISTLRQEILQLEGKGIVGQRVYNQDAGNFEIATGA